MAYTHPNTRGMPFVATRWQTSHIHGMPSLGSPFDGVLSDLPWHAFVTMAWPVIAFLCNYGLPSAMLSGLPPTTQYSMVSQIATAND